MTFDFFRSGSVGFNVVRGVSAAILCAALLQGCGGGSSGDAGTGSSTAPPPGSTNRAPTISGSPGTQATAGQAYTFTPSAADADGDTLTFSIANKPTWATFTASNGQLTGTPPAAGSFADVIISVSDGTATTALGSFTITVAAASSSTPPPSSGTGSATIAWMPPTTKTDGSSLTNLAGYRIDYRTATGGVSSVTVSNPGTTTYTIDNLSAGTYFFSVVAFDATGVESSPSSEVSKTIG